MSLDTVLNEWFVALPSKEVSHNKISTARILGEEIIIWKADGRVLAWQDLCVHRGSKLSLGWIKEDRLVCAYHGWEYDASGQCVRFPAHPEQVPPSRAHVRVYNSSEKYGLVWVSLGNPEREVPVFEEWYDESYRKILCGPYYYRASATRAVENFLDVTHFPFVHSGLLGDESKPEISDYDVRVENDTIVASNVRVWQPDPDGTGRPKEVVYTYKVLRPFTAYLKKETDEGNFCIFATVTPIDEKNSVAWLYIALNYALDKPEDELRRFQDKITNQDIPVVESQRPELLPLDLSSELHLKSDRVSIAYRKWLRSKGITFGTT